MTRFLGASPSGARQDGPAARPTFRQLFRERFEQADAAARRGDFAQAAARFALVAANAQFLGDPIAAAEALLELGAAQGQLGRTARLPRLAELLRELARSEGLPEGGRVSFFVFASFLERAPFDPAPFATVVQERRRLRRQERACLSTA